MLPIGPLVSSTSAAGQSLQAHVPAESHTEPFREQPGASRRPHGEVAGPPGGPDYVRLDPDMRARPDVVAEASRLPFRGVCFDVLLCTQALQYVADPVGAVREFARVLRPGVLLS